LVTCPTVLYTLSLHDALPIYGAPGARLRRRARARRGARARLSPARDGPRSGPRVSFSETKSDAVRPHGGHRRMVLVMTRTGIASDRKSTRLNSSHVKISYAVF